MLSILCFFLAAACEIAGCYTVWMWMRLGRSAWWLVPGSASLLLFAWLLTRVEADFAGRAYAAYGGIYILASLGWLRLVERTPPSATDFVGVSVCLLGALIILFGAKWPLL